MKNLHKHIGLFLLLGGVFLGIWGCASLLEPDEPEFVGAEIPLLPENVIEKFGTSPSDETSGMPDFVQSKPADFESAPPSTADIFIGFLQRDGLDQNHLNIPYDRSKSGNQLLFESKCGKCHPLTKPLSKRKSFEEWDKTTVRMREILPVWISDEERRSIIYYLVKIRGIEEPKKISAEQAFFENKCSRCHSIDRSLFALKPQEEWPEVIDRMREKAPEWITEEESKRISEYLLENIKSRRAGLHDDNKISSDQTLFEVKCGRCHALDRALDAGDFTSDDWVKTVKRMRFKVPDWISSREAKRIIDYLTNVNKMKKEIENTAIPPD